MKKYEIVVNDLIGQMKDGTLAPGGALPSEAKLSQFYNISRITAQKALNDLEKMGYVERYQGKGTFVSHKMLHVDEQKFVFMIIPNTIPNSLKIIEGAEKVLAEQGINVSIIISGDSAELELESLQRALDSKALGILLYLNHDKETPLLVDLLYQHYPIVFIDKSYVDIPCSCVSTDGFNGSLALTDHIIQKGHTQIGFIGIGLHTIETVRQRYAGYAAAMNRAGLLIDEEWVIGTGNIARQLEQLLLSGRYPSAFLCSNDNFALLLHKTATLLGLHIPEAVSIASFDGGEQTRHLVPTITEAVQPFSLIGSTAAELLLEKLAGEKVHKKIYLPVTISEGQSVAQHTRRLYPALA